MAWDSNEAKAGGAKGAGDRGRQRRPSGGSSAGGLQRWQWLNHSEQTHSP
ncbi:MAG: hypothetical protein GY874_00280 [Desulfobacteraceae bacterium]|nr:hypothetical protein [Desulfobacteraceae bacterium]